MGRTNPAEQYHRLRLTTAVTSGSAAAFGRFEASTRTTCGLAMRCTAYELVAGRCINKLLEIRQRVGRRQARPVPYPYGRLGQALRILGRVPRVDRLSE